MSSPRPRAQHSALPCAPLCASVCASLCACAHYKPIHVELFSLRIGLLQRDNYSCAACLCSLLVQCACAVCLCRHPLPRWKGTEAPPASAENPFRGFYFRLRPCLSGSSSGVAEATSVCKTKWSELEVADRQIRDLCRWGVSRAGSPCERAACDPAYIVLLGYTIEFAMIYHVIVSCNSYSYS